MSVSEVAYEVASQRRLTSQNVSRMSMACYLVM